MELEKTGIGNNPVHDTQQQEKLERIAQKSHESLLKQRQDALESAREKISPEEYLKKIMRLTSTLDRRLKISVDYETNNVIVKVVDKETDKVIKEIPPEGLRLLYMRIKETGSFLVDEEI